jgi:hypothetical protein
MARIKKKRARPVNYELIERPDSKNRGRSGAARAAEIYQLIDDTLVRHHSELVGAHILAAWRLGWKADKDGRLILGQCKKASDISKELAAHDFIILLNQEAWSTLEGHQKAALIDHELCHAAPMLDPNDETEQLRDERGRPLWRLRKHDVEEFTEVVKRYGLYKGDLERFAGVAVAKLRAGPQLFDGARPDDDTSVTLTTPDGKSATTTVAGMRGLAAKLGDAV